MELTGSIVLDDGVMRAELVHDDWLFIYWVTNKIGRLPKKLIKDLREMEELIRRRGWKGWLVNSEKDHTDMHKIIRKVGGEQYDEADDLLYFKKEILHV